MALIFMDGFDHYATADITRKWNSIVGTSGYVYIASGAGRRGGAALQVNNASYVWKNFAAVPTVIVGFAYKPAALYASVNTNTDIVDFTDGSIVHVSVHPQSDGSLKVYRGEATTLLGSSAAGVLTVGNYNYIEAKVTISDTAGAVELRVNGVAALTLSGIDTRNAGNGTVDGVMFGGSVGVNVNMYFDDLYICDTSGAHNNDFLGDVRIEPFFPSADGTHADFTPSPTQSVLDATYTYWRVMIDTTQVQYATIWIAEIEMRATVGGADQCAGGTATQGSGSNVASMFDNNPSTSGYLTATPSWVQYQFATAVSVKELSLRADASPNGMLAEFRLQASNDGAAFIDIAAFATGAWNPNEARAFAVPPATHANAVNAHTTGVQATGRTLTGGGAGTKESFTLAPAGTLPASELIVAVQVNNYVKKSDAGGAAVRNLVRSGSTEAVGPTVALSTSYNYVRSLHELNPATGEPWLLAEVQAMEAGLEVVS